MEQINYNKLQYDITRNKHFTMIERPERRKHLLTLKDRYRCQQRLQILRLDHKGHSQHPQEPGWTFFENYFWIFPVLDNYLSEGVLQETKWSKLAQSTPKCKLLNMHFCLMLYQKYLKNKVLSKWLLSSWHTLKMINTMIQSTGLWLRVIFQIVFKWYCYFRPFNTVQT